MTVPPLGAAPVSILAPIGADASNTARILGHAGVETRICADMAAAAEAVTETCGALLLTEEATASPDNHRLRDALAAQPPWSDLPVILISSRHSQPNATSEALKALGSPHSAILLERPLHAATLVAAVNSGLAARRRQFQVRELLLERDKLLNSLEAQIADRTAKLRHVIEELEGFSYSVSHDLRAPLRVLDGYARALVEDYGDKLDAGGKLYLERISRAARRMDRLTQDVLAYSRVSRMQLTLQPIDLETVIGDVIDQYPTLSPFRDRFEIRRPLGSVMGHPPLLVQCFSNLLENAVKFSEPTRPLRVVIRSETDGVHARVHIEDNGRGIAAENFDRIFGLFERAASNDVEGTGVGLAIVKRAVDRMGGTVRVTSKVGEGTQFCVELLSPPAGARNG